MATTLYLPSSGSPPLASLAVDSNWELTNGLVRLPCKTTKQNTALTPSQRTWPATSTQQWCWYQYQSEQLLGAYSWTTADTVSMVIGKLAETTTSGDTHLAYVVRVVSSDGATIRGVVGLYHATSTEVALMASAATRIHNARTNGATNFSSQIGDRIIIEIGWHGFTPAAELTQMRVGDPSATSDFALTSGLTTDLCPWVRLSQTVTFGVPPVNLVVQDSSHSHSVDNTVLTQVHALVLADISHSNITDSVLLTQVHNLAVQDCTHSQTADNVILEVQSSILLIVQDVTHGQTAEGIIIIEHKTLSVFDSAHGHSCESVTIIQHYTLSVADSVHGHSAEAVVLTESKLLSCQDSIHSQSVESVRLSQVHILISGDTSHSLLSDIPDLTEQQVLVVSDTVHASLSDNVELNLSNILIVEDCTHSQIVDVIVFTVLYGKLKYWNGSNWIRVSLT